VGEGVEEIEMEIEGNCERERVKGISSNYRA